MVRIEAFGELSVVREAERAVLAPPEAPQLRALLTLLACHGTGGVSRTRAAALLKPDALDESEWWATITALTRRWLGDAHVTVTDDHVALRAALSTSDVEEFTQALASGDLERAVHLHHDRLVDGHHHRESPAFERWLQLQRERLASEASSACERLAEEASRRGEPLAAVRWWRQLATQQPLNQRIAASLMEALVAAGDREGAVRHARFLEALAAEQLDLPDDQQVLAMVRALRGEGAASATDEMPSAEAVADPLATFRAAVTSRYQIEGEVGRGGHGSVLRATDLRHDRAVAIKVLHPALAPAYSATRFAREIRVVAALQHPHILPLYDSGSEGGTLYFVMPLVEGGSVRDRLRREGTIPLREALGIARQVASALAEAQRRGVVHRDIKPENILLAGQAALLADFGIACALDQHDPTGLTAPGLVVGTPAYMSPEQAAPGERIDGRADIYSLGCVLFEMLHGAPPFDGDTAQAVLARHATTPAPRLSTLHPELPGEVSRLVQRALAKHPDERFRSAAEFEAALDAALTGLTACPPATNRSKTHRWKSNRARLLALLAGALLLSGTLSIMRTSSPRSMPATAPVMVSTPHPHPEDAQQ